jgi:hypothetical protein
VRGQASVRLSHSSEPACPISGPAPVMGEGQNEESLFLRPIDDGVRKTRQRELTRLSTDLAPRLRVPLQMAEGLFDHSQEDFTEPRRLTLVESRDLQKLSPGQRMSRRGGHLSLALAARRTSEEGSAVTSPLRISS